MRPKPHVDDSGASAVEYGLLVFAVAAIIAVVVFALGGTVLELFKDSCEEFDQQASTTATCQ